MPTEGYGFVPLPGSVHRAARPHAVFDRRPAGTLSLVFEVTYRAVQPIHVGAGSWRLERTTAVRSAVRSGDRPVLPGSSLKGVLRARYEALTRSCAVMESGPKDKSLTSRLPSRTYPQYHVKFSPALRQHEVFTRCTKAQMCSACALFGMMSQRSRVAVHDMVAPAGMRFETVKLPVRYLPRPHHLGRYDVDHDAKIINVKRLRGRKFYVGDAAPPRYTEHAEAIPAGTLMSGRIVCTNVLLGELGGLLSALGFRPASQLKVGSAKAYRFGQFELAGIELVHGDMPDGLLERARAELKASPDYHLEGEKRLLMLHRGEWT